MDMVARKMRVRHTRRLGSASGPAPLVAQETSALRRWRSPEAFVP